jgi:VanZ family protein
MVDSTPPELKSKRFLLFWLPVLVWAGLIFWLSSLSVTPEPEAVRGFPGWSQEAHFTLYLVLGALLCRAIAIPSPAMGISVPMVIGGLYAISDEFHQYFVPGRQADILDLAVDCAGLVAGILLVFCYISVRPDRKGR